MGLDRPCGRSVGVRCGPVLKSWFTSSSSFYTSNLLPRAPGNKAKGRKKRANRWREIARRLTQIFAPLRSELHVNWDLDLLLGLELDFFPASGREGHFWRR